MNEQDLRLEVAECNRLLEYMGLIDFSGHVSARIPGTDQVIINNYGTNRCGIKPGDLIKVNLEGKLLEGSGQPPIETPIHTSVYRARPDVFAVAHIHPPHATALFLSGRPFLPVIFHGSIFAAGVPLYNDSRHVDTVARADAMTKALGNARVVAIRGHGATVATESVKSCFFACVYLEDNCQKLLQAYQAGGSPIGLPREEIDEGQDRIWRDRQFNKIWNYYKEKSGVDLSK